jgi:DNA-binding transcriptional ArsR family regulator
MSIAVPRTADELNEIVAGLFAVYVEEGRQAILAALEQRSVGDRKMSRSPPSTRRRRARGGRRRGAEEIAELASQLLAAVRQHPGESMPFFEAQLGVPRRSLARPMSQLRHRGLVRKVGDRHSAKYFPMVAPEGED